MPTLLTTHVRDRSAWRAEDLNASQDWIYPVTDDHCAEFEAALDQCRDKEITAIRAEDFPIPTFAACLPSLLREIEYGRGIVVIRGLPIGTRFSEPDAARIYWGVASHLGGIVPQNRNGDLIGNIRNEGAKTPFGRTYATNTGDDFHTDFTDFAGLMCLHQALHGGNTRLVSSVEMYNLVLDEQPEYLPILYKNLATDWMSEEPSGSPGWYWLPLYSQSGGKLSGMLRTQRAMRAMRFEDVPRLSASEIACFLYLESLPKRPGMAFEFTMQPGDIQFVSSYTVLHARTSFVDHPTDPDLRRHLLRLWISRGENGRSVCDEYAVWRQGISRLSSCAPDA